MKAAPIKELLKRCSDRDVKSRLRDIGEARVAIQTYLANPASGAEPIWKAESLRHSRWPWAAALGVTFLALVVLAFVHFREAPPPERPLMRFTDDLGAEISVTSQLGPAVAISADGARIAYVQLGVSSGPYFAHPAFPQLGDDSVIDRRGIRGRFVRKRGVSARYPQRLARSRNLAPNRPTSGTEPAVA